MLRRKKGGLVFVYFWSKSLGADKKWGLVLNWGQVIFGEGVVIKWNYEPYSKLGLTIQKKRKEKQQNKNDNYFSINHNFLSVSFHATRI